MRVVVPYAAIHPQALYALNMHAPDAELAGPLDAMEGYYWLLHELWEGSESFVIVEHDIAIHDRVIPEFEACPEPWCVFPYSGGSETLDFALGCARFSADLLVAHPSAVEDFPDHEWWHLDAMLAGILWDAGLHQHVHEPPVEHWHEWKIPAHHQFPCPCPTCRWAGTADKPRFHLTPPRPAAHLQPCPCPTCSWVATLR